MPGDARPAGRSIETDRRILIALVLLGVILRVYQWAMEGSLWLDEILITRNIVALTPKELATGPLALDQVAPPGFLLAVKLATMMFGSSERALWLVPLLSGIAGLLLFARLAQRILRGYAVVIAVGLFAVGLCLIRYSGEVKQYGLDATAAIALTTIALDLRQRDRTNGELALAGGAAFVVILFSQAAALVMAGLGCALALAWLFERDRRTLRVLFVTVPMWAVASVTAIVMGERSMLPSTRAFMHDFWRGGFLPLPPRLSTAAPWLWQRLAGLFGDPWTLRYPAAWIFALLAIIGIAVLWRRDRGAALMLAGPLVLTLAASVAQQYPFRTRLVVFLVPGAVLAAAAGAGWIADQAGRRHPIAGWIVASAALIPAIAVLVIARLPVHVDNYYPVYAHLQANRRPGDAVYVAFLANSSAIYYGPRYGLAAGEYDVGTCERNDTRVYLRDLDRFRGRPRVWIITKGAIAFTPALESMRRYLSVIGVRRSLVVSPSPVTEPSTIELYDLSDAARLAAASAETFPVSKMLDYPKPGCRDFGTDPREILRRRSM